jgi:hypothetical protein
MIPCRRPGVMPTRRHLGPALAAAATTAKDNGLACRDHRPVPIPPFDQGSEIDAEESAPVAMGVEELILGNGLSGGGRGAPLPLEGEGPRPRCVSSL